MAQLVTELFNKGTYNLVNDENIPQEASSDSLGWISTDDQIELSRGRLLHGQEKTYKTHEVQRQVNSSIPFGEEDMAGKNIKIFQSFTPTSNSGSITTQDIDGFFLYKRPDTGTFTGSVTISLQTESAGVPDGVSIDSVTITNASWLNIGTGTFQVLFATTQTLSVGVSYCIVAEASTADNTNHPNLGYMNSSVYTTGVLKSNNTPDGWQSITGDLFFHTIEEMLVADGVKILHVGYKADGKGVILRKAGTSIQYYDSNADCYIDIVSNLSISIKTSSFTNYTSLAGNSVFIGTKDGLWKVMIANPQNAIDVYDSSKNFKGRVLADRGRLLLWGREQDRTGLYGSKIDPQDGTVYTTVSAESLGVLGSTTYRGVLSFKAGGTKRTCFGLLITASYLDGATTRTETFNDDYSGNLTSAQGGTGTINYTTGVYEITFANTTTTNPAVDYQWEDSTLGGVADFTKSTPRVAGEGFVFRQDLGGDEILDVKVQEGTYISLKKRSSYQLTISDDDESASNLPYRVDIGIPSPNASINTSSGIFFMNTANPDKPILTTLQRVSSASVLEPVIIAQQYDFSLYDWSDCYFETYNEYVVMATKIKGSDNNDRLLVFNPRLNAIEALPFRCNTLVKLDGVLYGGSSINHSVSKILNDFSDDGSVIENYFITRNELFGTQNLKKEKRLRVKGLLSRDQSIKVSISYDNGAFQQIGTILGDGSYVDYIDSYTIGSSGIGESTIGGEGSLEASMYHLEIKITRPPKFRSRRLKFEALGMGYASINLITDYDIWKYENKLPTRNRLKQNVSLDGETVDE